MFVPTVENRNAWKTAANALSIVKEKLKIKNKIKELQSLSCMFWLVCVYVCVCMARMLSNRNFSAKKNVNA